MTTIRTQDIEIRNAADEEFDFCAFVEMFHTYFIDDLEIVATYSQIEEVCSKISDNTKKGLEFLDVLRMDQELLGFVNYQIDSPEHDWCQKEGFGFFREMYVKKEFRRNGLGEMLLANAERNLRDKNVKQIYLTSDSCEGFWIRQGYGATQEVGYKNDVRIYLKMV